MTTLADALKHAVSHVKNERAERAALEARLLGHLFTAASDLQTALRDAGLARANVEALTHNTGRANYSHAATGAQAADGQEIRFVAAVPAYRNGHNILSLHWRHAADGAYGDDLPAGWAAADKTDERHETALLAVVAAMGRPETARRIAEVLVELGA